MAIFYHKDDSIEGKQLVFETRQFNPQRPYMDKTVLKQMIFPFKMGIQGTISIEQELEPKIAVFRQESALNKDDGLRGQSISGFSTRVIPETHVGPTTHTHKATGGKTKPAFSYATIDIPKREIAQKA